MDWEENTSIENAEMIPELLSDHEMIEYVKKLMSLSSEHKQTIFDNIDFLYTKEGH